MGREPDFAFKPDISHPWFTTIAIGVQNAMALETSIFLPYFHLFINGLLKCFAS